VTKRLPVRRNDEDSDAWLEIERGGGEESAAETRSGSGLRGGAARVLQVASLAFRGGAAFTRDTLAREATGSKGARTKWSAATARTEVGKAIPMLEQRGFIRFVRRDLTNMGREGSAAYVLTETGEQRALADRIVAQEKRGEADAERAIARYEEAAAEDAMREFGGRARARRASLRRLKTAKRLAKKKPQRTRTVVHAHAPAPHGPECKTCGVKHRPKEHRGHAVSSTKQKVTLAGVPVGELEVAPGRKKRNPDDETRALERRLALDPEDKAAKAALRRARNRLGEGRRIYARDLVEELAGERGYVSLAAYAAGLRAVLKKNKAEKLGGAKAKLTTPSYSMVNSVSLRIEGGSPEDRDALGRRIGPLFSITVHGSSTSIYVWQKDAEPYDPGADYGTKPSGPTIAPADQEAFLGAVGKFIAADERNKKGREERSKARRATRHAAEGSEALDALARVFASKDTMTWSETMRAAPVRIGFDVTKAAKRWLDEGWVALGRDGRDQTLTLTDKGTKALTDREASILPELWKSNPNRAKRLKARRARRNGSRNGSKKMPKKRATKKKAAKAKKRGPKKNHGKKAKKKIASAFAKFRAAVEKALKTKKNPTPKALRAAISSLKRTAREMRKRHPEGFTVKTAHGTRSPLRELASAIGSLKAELRKAKPQKPHGKKNPNRAKKRGASKATRPAKRRKNCSASNPSPVLATLNPSKVGKTYGDLPPALKKRYRKAATMAARFDGIPLNDVPVTVVKTTHRSKHGLVSVGEHAATQYKKAKGSKRSGYLWHHAAGDHGRGSKKTKPAIVAVDADTKQQILVARRGSKPGFSSDRGLTG
jgi:hypothetical protein